MKGKRRFAIFALVAVSVFAFALLSGCTVAEKKSGGEKGGAGEGLANVAQKIGMDKCLDCHVAGGIGDGTGKFTSAYAKWLKGPHGNFNYFDNTFTKNEYEDFLDSFTYPDDYSLFVGFPDFQRITDEVTDPDSEYYGQPESYCYGCHGPSDLDNQHIADLPLVDDSGDIDWGNATQAARPVVGCENCHGGASMHQVDPTLLPYLDPPASQCGQCHNKNFPEPHLTYHPNGLGGEGNPGIFEAYSGSPHASSINEHNYADAEKTKVRARCSKCHTDEGARKYRDIDGDHDALVTAFENEPDLTEFNPVQCRTCHDAHNPEELLEEADTVNGETWSAQFKTCTNCHQLLDSSNQKIVAYHDPIANPYGSDEEIITDTHYDDPTTPADQAIEGYVVKKGDDDSCTGCHNPHSGDITKNEQWAQSGHGDEAGEAWVHYNWDDTSTRGDCQRCHTATGFKNFATDPANYDPANNDFSHLANWSSTGGSPQNELLYCWACHTDYSGNLRDPGALSVTSPYSEPATRIAAVPDVNGSNVCLACHSGRSSGQAIKDATDINTNFGSFNSHYLAAGGILFRTVGYEFDGVDYSNVPYFEHDLIGTPNSEEDTGDEGPCVECHMNNSHSHEFMPVAHDDQGNMTEILSNANVCSKCHTGQYALTVEKLEEEEEGFDNALTVISDLLAARGIYYNSSKYPYFFSVSDPDQQSFATAYTNWSSKDELGAAFNLNLLTREPGAYAHNRFYTKRLIFDSIDYLDNGTLDGTIDLSSYPVAAEWFQGDGDTSNDGNVARP
ncbi:MAG: hypothetical protein D6713_10315 [Deltaproteobacteria bacterium]|nr:MAG: hypothetical protein D6713_10315 [Deltaproteobacteria bacterium]